MTDCWKRSVSDVGAILSNINMWPRQEFQVRIFLRQEIREKLQTLFYVNQLQRDCNNVHIRICASVQGCQPMIQKLTAI